MQRWEVYHDGVPYESDNGRWVKYDDAQKCIAELGGVNATLLETLEEAVTACRNMRFEESDYEASKLDRWRAIVAKIKEVRSRW